MVLIVKDKATGQVHEIVKFLASTEGEQCVWSLAWPGRHIIGQDCDWVPISAEEWERIKYIRDNPEMTIKQLSKELKIPYWMIYRLVDSFDLQIKQERTRGQVKKKQYWNNKKKRGPLFRPDNFS